MARTLRQPATRRSAAGVTVVIAWMAAIRLLPRLRCPSRCSHACGPLAHTRRSARASAHLRPAWAITKRDHDFWLALGEVCATASFWAADGAAPA